MFRNLHDNSLKGTIPSEIGLLENLQELYVLHLNLFLDKKQKKTF